MLRHFAELARRNNPDMKWKKFFYRMICRDEGFSMCVGSLLFRVRRLRCMFWQRIRPKPAGANALPRRAVEIDRYLNRPSHNDRESTCRKRDKCLARSP